MYLIHTLMLYISVDPYDDCIHFVGATYDDCIRTKPPSLRCLRAPGVVLDLRARRSDCLSHLTYPVSCVDPGRRWSSAKNTQQERSPSAPEQEQAVSRRVDRGLHGCTLDSLRIEIIFTRFSLHSILFRLTGALLKLKFNCQTVEPSCDLRRPAARSQHEAREQSSNKMF